MTLRASSARFRPAERVVTARDYSRVRRRGNRVASKNFAVSIATREGEAVDLSGASSVEREDLCTRLGLIVSKRVGNAVARNRVKRAIREWFRHSERVFAPSADIVVIARQGAASRETHEIDLELTALLKKYQLKQNAKNDRTRA